MNIHQKTVVCGLAIFFLLATSTSTWSQQSRATGRTPRTPKPRPTKAAVEKKPRPAPQPHHDAAVPAPHAAAPPPAPAAAKPAKPADEPVEQVQPLLETNPAVRTALELPRKEPRDFVQAILWLIDLGRPELAKPIMTELSKLPVTDAQRVAIVSEFGSQGMLHLASATELAPDGAAFADACMTAANAAATNPQRIAALVKQLSDPALDVRVIARNDLAATGQVGATAALETLAHETDPQRRAVLVEAIELMHPLVDGPLLAMLETSDANLRSDVATLLQRLAVPQATPFLLASSASAERAVTTALANYQHGTPPFGVDDSDRVELWQWDDATKKLTSMRLPADEAQVLWIARLAAELARLRPNSYADQRQALVLRLESAGIAAPLPSGKGQAGGALNSADPPSRQPSPKGRGSSSIRLTQADPRMLNDALAVALKNNYSHAALAIVEALAGRGDANILITADGRPSPLADALNSPSRRVRFAALQAIMALNPAAPYPGSSRVPDTLTWFALGTGERQAMVAMPTNAAASDLAGQLAAYELAAEATNRGRDAVDLARAMPSLEIILIDMNILAPDIRQVLYELRSSPTTGDIPIALLAADGRLDDAKRLAAEHTRVIAVPRPHAPEALANIVADLAKLMTHDEVPAEQRTAQAEQAKKWLAQLSSGNRPFYTIRRMATFTPAAARPPAAAPAALPAP
jgi:CheY-like chemotaxis protein